MSTLMVYTVSARCGYESIHETVVAPTPRLAAAAVQGFQFDLASDLHVSAEAPATCDHQCGTGVGAYDHEGNETTFACDDCGLRYRWDDDAPLAPTATAAGFRAYCASLRTHYDDTYDTAPDNYYYNY